MAQATNTALKSSDLAPAGAAAIMSVIGALATGNAKTFTTAALWWLLYVVYTGILINRDPPRPAISVWVSSFVGGLCFILTIFWWSKQGNLSFFSGGPLTMPGVLITGVSTCFGIAASAWARSLLLDQLKKGGDLSMWTKFEDVLNRLIKVVGTIALLFGAFLKATGG